MEIFSSFIDIILNLDAHLIKLAVEYGIWIYVILFMIIYCETGLVIFPFLPGDSLLFVAGALCGMGTLDLHILAPLLILAAFTGDNTNYWIGRILGVKVLDRIGDRYIKQEHLAKTRSFYVQHGGKTILFARFLPILRTFAPFIAGIGHMNYRHFVFYSALGAVIWIISLTFAGYYFGNIPIIKDNLTLMILVVITLTLLPAIRSFFKHRRQI